MLLLGAFPLLHAKKTPGSNAFEPSFARIAIQTQPLVADGKVVEHEIAEVLRDDDLPTIGASSLRVQSGTRVDMLKGGEFLRISMKRERER